MNAGVKRRTTVIMHVIAPQFEISKVKEHFHNCTNGDERSVEDFEWQVDRKSGHEAFMCSKSNVRTK